VQIAGLNGQDVTAVVSSFSNAGALLSSGAFYDWGYNAAGQLGDGQLGTGSKLTTTAPVQVPASPASLISSTANDVVVN
jgi:hypothetical protein